MVKSCKYIYIYIYIETAHPVRAFGRPQPGVARNRARGTLIHSLMEATSSPPQHYWLRASSAEERAPTLGDGKDPVVPSWGDICILVPFVPREAQSDTRPAGTRMQSTPVRDRVSKRSSGAVMSSSMYPWLHHMPTKYKKKCIHSYGS